MGDKTKDYLVQARYMAKKKSTSRKTKKPTFYPVVRGSELGSTAENTTVRVLDTARNLSVLNRRLYRFTRCYPVKIDMDAGTTQTVEVYALRNDWAVQKGIQMAYQMYLDNTADERKAMSASQIARWEDFRIDVGITGSTQSLLPVLHDESLATSILTAGEFVLTNVVDSGNTKRTFTMGIPSGAEYGVLQEYDKSGNAQLNPSSVPADLPYADIETQVNDATADDLKTDGNAPPYDQTGVNATTPWVRIATLAIGPAGDQKLSTGYFDAPLGIVVCVGNNSTWNSNALRFEVKAGDYKGVHAPSMLE